MKNDGFERFTLSQAAKELGISIPSARRLIFKGKLQGFKVKKGDKERWELLRSEVFRLKHSEVNIAEAFTQEPDENWSELKATHTPKASEGFEAFEQSVPLAAHLVAIELARDQIAHLQRLFEESQRMMLHAERTKTAIEAQSQHQIAQYQRVLAESSESLAEERAMRLAAEAKALELAAIESKKEALEESAPATPVDLVATVAASPTKRRGWGSRLKVWLLGEKAV